MCEMCGVDNFKRVLPLRLRGGALSVYQQLTRDQKEDLQQLKQALLVAFSPDPFVAFDTFVSRCLRPRETVDEYLGDLQDLACLIEENTSDRWLSCTFVSGLLCPVRRQLRGSSRMEHVTLEQILARARALMTEEAEVDEPVVAAAGRCRVLPHVPVAPPSTPRQAECNRSAMLQVWRFQSLYQRLSAARGPITKSAPGYNAVISANNKDMSHRGVQEN